MVSTALSPRHATPPLIPPGPSTQAACQALVTSLLAHTLRGPPPDGGPTTLLILSPTPEALGEGGEDYEGGELSASSHSAFLPAWLALLRGSELPPLLLFRSRPLPPARNPPRSVHPEDGGGGGGSGGPVARMKEAEGALGRIQRAVFEALMAASRDACRNLDLALRLPMVAAVGAAGTAGATGAVGQATAVSETAALAAMDNLGGRVGDEPAFTLDFGGPL